LLKKKICFPNINDLAPLSVKDSFDLANLPALVLPEWLKGPNAPFLPYIVDNSINLYWRPVFAQVSMECGQASGVGLGFTYASTGSGICHQMLKRINIPLILLELGQWW